eukprot:TRINITY_DN2676_c0_g1_i1.p1 TRINITY_DN2676_c0_g1~~TRINITY_DN2676_c0_g1_i1.p1  ORF type:complete len:399 (-),score=72.02 TRINITY_DN2676_c0_g1_i1:607-1644(-)
MPSAYKASYFLRYVNTDGDYVSKTSSQTGPNPSWIRSNAASLMSLADTKPFYWSDANPNLTLCGFQLWEISSGLYTPLSFISLGSYASAMLNSSQLKTFGGYDGNAVTQVDVQVNDPVTGSTFTVSMVAANAAFTVLELVWRSYIKPYLTSAGIISAIIVLIDLWNLHKKVPTEAKPPVFKQFANLLGNWIFCLFGGWYIFCLEVVYVLFCCQAHFRKRVGNALMNATPFGKKFDNPPDIDLIPSRFRGCGVCMHVILVIWIFCVMFFNGITIVLLGLSYLHWKIFQNRQNGIPLLYEGSVIASVTGAPPPASVALQTTTQGESGGPQPTNGGTSTDQIPPPYQV